MNPHWWKDDFSRKRFIETFELTDEEDFLEEMENSDFIISALKRYR